MNRVIIVLGKTQLEYFIEGEVPAIGDILNIEGEEVIVSYRKFSFGDSRVENGKRIRKSTIRLIVKDLY